MNPNTLYLVLVFCLLAGLYDGYRKTQNINNNKRLFSKNILDFLLPSNEQIK